MFENTNTTTKENEEKKYGGEMSVFLSHVKRSLGKTNWIVFRWKRLPEWCMKGWIPVNSKKKISKSVQVLKRKLAC